MNIDKELNCVDLVRAVIRIHELCSKRPCKNCIFSKGFDNLLCTIEYPLHWKIDSLNKWLKEHESGETIAHWENIKTAKNTIKCSNCGHIRELKHFNEIIKRPVFCEMCGVKMKKARKQNE